MEVTIPEILVIAFVVVLCVLIGYALGVGTTKRDNEKS